MEKSVKFRGGGTISVIIPVYNAEKYLACCLESVINNTYKNLEIICVNDGSTDGSLAILNEYAAKDSRIVVLSQENAGVSAARNLGLDNATGEYIAFVDADDYIHHKYFEILMKPFKAFPCDVSVARFKMVHEHDKIGDEEAECEITCINTVDGIFGSKEIRSTSTCKIYTHEFIQNERFPYGIVFEDLYFNGVLFAKREHAVVGFIDAGIYYCRPVQTSITHTTDPINQIVVVELFLQVMQEKAIRHKKHLLVFAIRTFLYARNLTGHNTNASKRYIKKTEKDLKAALSAVNGITVAEKIVWYVLLSCQFIYKIGVNIKQKISSSFAGIGYKRRKIWKKV